MAPAPSQNSDRRPSPDALLELAERESRGKLKVFLGMAPGVGKTYAMLSAARALKADGVDVVVGVVETHGRAETEALLGGLEILPRRAVPYRDRTLMELDVEAAIARRPKLLLVDELAHSNAPGLLHVKRYQDVAEVQDAGIDVWTTLNIQHVESLKDVIERIAGISVRETVPDSELERADEIVVIDLAPEDLIARLKEGKVYLPENARRAMDRFFKLSNLTALRELALRRTADRVDEQMLSQLRRSGIEGAWPTAERLLVCVGSDALSETVIRTASRMATAQKSDWVALHLTRSDRETGAPAVQQRIEELMRLAERLGADTVRLSGSDMTAEILAYARRNNITQIVIGRSDVGVIRRWLGRSLSEDLVRRAHDLSVQVIAPEADAARPRGTLPTLSALPGPTELRGALVAVTAVAAAVLAGRGLERVTELPNLSMVFLLAVLFSALRFGLWPALVASLLSFLAYNFFFIEPRLTFTIARPYELLSLLIFLAVAFVTGTLAGRQREQAVQTLQRARATEALFDFSRKLAGTSKVDDVVWALASQVAMTVKGGSIVLMPSGGELAIVGGWPSEDQLSTSDWTAARWTFDKREPAGRGTGTLPASRYQYRPLASAHGVVGVVGLEGPGLEAGLPFAVQSALQSFLDQSAIAIERTRLADNAAEAKAAADGEKLRSALLSSISHDLRTPLASIVGSVTSLRTLGYRMSKSERTDLLATIEEEAGRLSRFVANLLDMTRLESGAIDIRRDWVDVGEIVASAVERGRKAFPARRITTAIAEGMPLIRGDAALLEQVVFNLLDNAHKYSQENSPTEVAAKAGTEGIVISVSDEGIGIPADALEKVFDKFYRVAGSDGRAPGTGLGLSICAGIVKGMGGSIKAESPVRSGRGTRVTITLPVEAEVLHHATGESR